MARFTTLVAVGPETIELQAVATASGGSTAEAHQALTVAAPVAVVVTLRASRPGGLAPLTTGFAISSLTGVANVALDADGSGTADFQGPTLGGQTFTCAQLGTYVPTVQITDPQGQIQTASTIVHVYDPALLDARLQGVWQGLRDALQAGDITRCIDLHPQRHTGHGHRAVAPARCG